MPTPPTYSADQLDRYDALMGRLERRLFPSTRGWVCGRAHGATLEVAIGTGLNLPHYPDHVALTGVDLNPSVLPAVRRLADSLGRDVELSASDASGLPFGDSGFDSVVCTFALCEVPSEAAVLAEMIRVLRPGGSLLLADHVASTSRVLRATQRALERVTSPRAGEHFTRRPARHLAGLGVRVVESERRSAGVIEQIHAIRL